MPLWLSPLYLILGKNIQFGIFVFWEVQEINLQGNIRGSKCDKFYENFFVWQKSFFLFTIRVCKIAIKSDSSPKYFLEVTKWTERLQQNALDKFRLRASLVMESFLLKLKIIAMSFEQDIFHNNLKDNIYWQIYS